MDKLGWRFNVVSGIPIISKEFCSTSENWSFGRYSTSLSSSVTFPSWKINDVINSKHLCYENIQCILLELSRSIPFWWNGSTQDVIDGPNCRLVLKQYNQRKKILNSPQKILLHCNFAVLDSVILQIFFGKIYFYSCSGIQGTNHTYTKVIVGLGDLLLN